MRVTSKGQVTIPQEVRDALGIRPAETEVEFVRDENGRWYLSKARTHRRDRFRTAHKVGTLRMSTEEILALTRGD
ncbi:transcriptional regulator, AbrB family [Nitrosococcus halophilus Nc 4]|uniref:Transcriptional regulator, AbrB family n=1 Tax=Nitrosococcus halophilus (strain Nc4) TaxID=472759 RepID=D5C3L2_NITHN|nr:AbrB/MazE/SpoVT family DNA-binding domain-containing protein [Nitrosococcus halophilus]ADE14984.1 transcriptional regulator, AbrB family [Nitrosococcus halophilus Nc 4]